MLPPFLGWRDMVLLILCVCVFVPMALYHPLDETTLDQPLSTKQFDVYLINMDNAKDRLKAFSYVYKQSDLAATHSFIRHAATDGRTLDIRALLTEKAYDEITRAERLSYRSKHYELTRGAVGCWLSHAQVWYNFLNSDKSVALIFEDDCVLVTDFMKQLEQVRLPKHWDVCLLGYFCNRCRYNPTAIKVDRFFGLHCYMITRSFAKKFFASPYSTRIGKQIDSVLSDMIADGTISVYASRKKLAWQNPRHRTSVQMPIRETPGVDVWATD